MDRYTHNGFAIFLLIISFALLFWLDLGEYAFYSFWLVVGASIPDILDPATDYKHRKFFHSKRLLKLISIALIPFFVLSFIFTWFLAFLFGVMGYISHLALDSLTPMGLPY